MLMYSLGIAPTHPSAGAEALNSIQPTFSNLWRRFRLCRNAYRCRMAVQHAEVVAGVERAYVFASSEAVSSTLEMPSRGAQDKNEREFEAVGVVQPRVLVD